MPGASFSNVIEPGGILLRIAAGLIVGLGYVPSRSPPACRSANLDHTRAPSAIISVVKAPSVSPRAAVAVSAIIACSEKGTEASLTLGQSLPSILTCSHNGRLVILSLLKNTSFVIGLIRPRYVFK